MSANWYYDIVDMHDHYGMTERFAEIRKDPELAKKLLKFRLDFINEELSEAYEATSADDVLDALIDICVVAIGTMDAFDCDGQEAWQRVLQANLAKKPGIKEGRPNPLGLPDLMKPEGWVAPTHADITGDLDVVFA